MSMSPPIKVTNEEARKAYHIRTSSQFLILVYSVVYSLFSWFLIFLRWVFDWDFRDIDQFLNDRVWLVLTGHDRFLTDWWPIWNLFHFYFLILVSLIFVIFYDFSLFCPFWLNFFSVYHNCYHFSRSVFKYFRGLSGRFIWFWLLSLLRFLS